MISELPYLKNIKNKFINKYFCFYKINIIIKHVLDHLSTSQVVDGLEFFLVPNIEINFFICFLATVNIYS